MTMEFETQPEADRGGPTRRWAAGLAAAMLVAAAGGVGFGIGYALGNDRADDPDTVAEQAAGAADDAAASTTVAPAPAPDDAAVTTEAPASLPDDQPEPATTDVPAVDYPVGPGYGSEMFYEWETGPLMVDSLAPMTVVYSRATDDGLTVRAQRGAEWPASEWTQDGWVQPGWCSPAGSLRITLSGEGVVDLNTVSWYRELYDGRATSLRFMGFADGAPRRVLVVQASPDIETVSVVFGDGASDTTATVDGLAILVVPGPVVAEGEDQWRYANEVEYELTLSGGGATVTVPHVGLDQWADAGFRQSCEPPPPALPDPGEQPADAALAEDEIRAAMGALYGGGADVEDNAAYLDDTTGVAEARQQVRDDGFEAEAASAKAFVEELVFTTPEEAWFRYRIETVGLDIDNRYGMAVVVDGSWRITRDTVCQDLAMAGGDCGAWQPVVLPG